MGKSSIGTTVVFGEDVDLLVLLIGRTSPDQNSFILKPGRGNIETQIDSSGITSIEKYSHCNWHISFLHAIIGCDTTCALFHKGKVNEIIWKTIRSVSITRSI